MTLALGPFTLDTRLAAGGMGEVWSGRHAAQDVPVAVKMITGEAARNPTYYQYFRREVQAAAALDHPGIVTLFDYGSLPDSAAAYGLVPGSPYLVMERADGALDRGAASWAELRALLLAVLDALAHAHSRGIVHRDLKPGNVLRFGAAGGARYKLADFGIARSVDASRRDGEPTGPEAAAGTPHYMPPEQWTGEWRDHGPWTDLYAVGVIAFELATGGVPFDGPVGEIMRAHLQAPVPPPTARFALPAGFDAWLSRMLDKAHWRRFSSARHAARALESLAAPQPDKGEPAPRAHGLSTKTAAGGEPADPGRRTRVEDTLDSPVERRGTWVEDTVDEKRRAPASARRVTLVEDTFEETFDDVDFGHGEPRPATLVEDTHAEQALAADVASLRSPAVEVESPIGPGSTSDVTALHRLPETWRGPMAARKSMRLIGAGLGLFGLREIPVVDRDAQRGALWQSVRRSAERANGVTATVLRGPSGVGKSRLAQWLCQAAAEQAGLHALRVTHQESGAASDGLSRLVEDVFQLRGLAPDAARSRVRTALRRQGERDRGAVDEIVALLELGAGDGGGSSLQVRSPAERHAVMLRILERITADVPAVVWIDDGQWGYEALHFVRFALDRTESSARLHFVITARDESLDTRLLEADLLEDLCDRDGVQELELGPLARPDTSELIERMLYLSHDVADHLVERVDGNPLFAVQLVADWVQRGVLRVGEYGFELDARERAVLPDDLHAVWRGRMRVVLDGAGADAELALQAAAILGRSIDENELGAVLDRLGVALPEATLEAMLTRRLASPAPDGWAFEHGLLQESLVRSAREAGRERELAAACADALTELHPTLARGVAERVARLRVRAGQFEAAIAPFAQAIDERIASADYDPAMALTDALEEAYDAAELGESDRRWGQLDNRRAQICRLRWRFDDARQHVERALAAARRFGWDREEAEATAIGAHLARQGGDLERAQAMNAEALARFQAVGDAVGQARTVLATAIVARQLGDFAGAEALYRDAHGRFEALDDRESMGKCLAGLGNVYRSQKRNALAAEQYEAARAIFDDIGARHELANAINNIAEIHRYAGELEEAERRYREAIAIHRAIGSNAHLVPQLNLGLVLRARSEFAGARDEFMRGARELEETGQRAFLAWTHANLLDCLARLGPAAEFDRFASSAETLLAETSMIDPDIAEAAFSAGEFLAAQGDAARSLRAYGIAESQWVALDDGDGRARVAAAIARLEPLP